MKIILVGFLMLVAQKVDGQKTNSRGSYFYTQELDSYLIDDQKVFDKNELARKHLIKNIFEVRIFNNRVDTVGYTEFDKKGFIKKNSETVGNYLISYSINRFRNDSLQVVFLNRSGKENIDSLNQVIIKKEFTFKKYLLVDNMLKPNGEYESLWNIPKQDIPMWDTYSSYYNRTIDSSRHKVNDTIIFTVKEQVGDSVRLTIRKNYKNLFIDKYDTEYNGKLQILKCRNYEVYDIKKRMIKKYSNCSNSSVTDSSVLVFKYEYDDNKKTRKEIEYHLNNNKIKAATTYNSRGEILEYYAFVFAAKDEERVTKFIYDNKGLISKELYYLNGQLRSTTIYKYSFFALGKR